MGLIKKNASFIVLAAVIYIVYFLTHPFNHLFPFRGHMVSVLGANTNLSLFEQPKDGLQPILSSIQSAQKNIDLEIYLLSDKEIISSLLKARAKGVTERIILEQHPFGGSSSNKKIQQILLKAGIPVRWADSSFAFTHEKMLIIDKNVVFILNQNLTASSFTKNREFNIIDTNPQDVGESEQQFDADWNVNQFVPTDPHLLVSPDSSRQGLIQLINNSAKSLDIEMEIIDDPMIINFLLQKAKTQRIRVILPDVAKVNANKDAISKLQIGGVLVKTVHTPYIHAKLMVIDANLATIGSINFSTESLDHNRELGIVISQEDIINRLNQDFESDWQNL